MRRYVKSRVKAERRRDRERVLVCLKAEHSEEDRYTLLHLYRWAERRMLTVSQRYLLHALERAGSDLKHSGREVML